MTRLSIPGYENLRQIGKGGFSRVYQAEQTKLKRQVAVKVLNFGLNDEADRKSFERETELMGRVSTHPNIVTVHDTEFTADGQPCIVMEHYPGGSLADFVGAVGPLHAKEVLEVGVAIASALEASHRAGILHCDLKPQNILVSEFGQPALGDFGISTFAEERSRTSSHGASGFTLAYAAPEIIEGASPSVQSDVYSLAATLYTTLAGQRPFSYRTADDEKPSTAEQARRILLEPVPPLTAFNVDPTIDALICGALSKEPEDRPESAAAFANELHVVGQQMGFATSAPRIADGGALSGSAAAIEELQLPPQPTIDLTQLRQIDPTVGVVVDLEDDSVPSQGAAPLVADVFEETQARTSPAAAPPVAAEVAPPVEYEPPEPEPSQESNRRLLAAGFLLTSVLVVAAVLILSLRGPSEEAVEPEPTTPSSAGSFASSVVAPGTPQGVEVVSLGEGGAVVLWQSNDFADETVSYEVRVQDVEGSSATTDGFMVVEELPTASAVCASVLAVRSNRASNPTSPVCLASLPMMSMTAAGNLCTTGECELVLELADAAPQSSVQLRLLDKFAKDIDDSLATFEQLATTDDGGAVSPWNVTIDSAFESQQVVAIFDVAGQRQALVLTVGIG